MRKIEKGSCRRRGRMDSYNLQTTEIKLKLSDCLYKVNTLKIYSIDIMQFKTNLLALLLNATIYQTSIGH